jgi:hypothetical protein
MPAGTFLIAELIAIFRIDRPLLIQRSQGERDTPREALVELRHRFVRVDETELLDLALFDADRLYLGR